MSLLSVLPGRSTTGHAENRAAGRRPLVIARWNTAMVLLPALIILVLGRHRRWISDDGLIFTRTVRQILAGHGPVFNVGERAEASTSTLWQWILVAGAGSTDIDVGRLAVHLGLACTVAGYALALDATRRLHRPRAGTGQPLLIPLGVLVPLALPPVWDFATSGLETGLTTLWLAGCWWLLVRLPHDDRRRVSYGLAFLAGLGPMVRPDLGIAAIGFLLALAVIRRPRPFAALRRLGVAAALPAAYEIFRMGYYGVLLPLPAVTKEASTAEWERGQAYLRDLTDPYRLWFPIVILLALAVGNVLWRVYGPAGTGAWPRPARFDRHRWARITVFATPVVCGAAMAGYVVRVGGDFMHGRMLLPALFALLLPVLLVPLGALAAPATAALIGWTLVCAITLRVPYEGVGPRGIADERGFYTQALGVANPVTALSYVANFPRFPDAVRAAGDGYRQVVVYPWHDGFYVTPLRPEVGARLGIVWPNLGMNGAATPLDGVSIDILGLAYPLAAHVELTKRGRPGHEKQIDIAWVFAQYTHPDAVLPEGIDPVRVKAARYALTCGTENRGKLKELQDSVSRPMTWDRFWDNLIGAPERTSFRFPSNPFEAVQKICGEYRDSSEYLPEDKPSP